jgi:hypothetical protein
MFARDKHSSLLRTFVNYVRKTFYNIGPRDQCYETSYEHNLKMFHTCWNACPWKYFQALSNIYM